MGVAQCSRLGGMQRKVIRAESAPAPIGPYNQAIEVSGARMLFISGQIGMGADGVMAGDNVEAQARQVCANLLAVLEAAGMTAANLVRTTIYLKDLNDFETVNRVYGEMVGDEPPARSTIQVVRLPKDALVEIDAIAVG